MLVNGMNAALEEVFPRGLRDWFGDRRCQLLRAAS